MVDIGTARLHLHESGSGSPTVILEAGIAASSLSWDLVQPDVAQLTRVCSYDRAGLGWSDLNPNPPNLQQIVADLHATLTAAAIPGPYILVGHSFGGLVVRAFAAAYPEESAGLVLVDPVLPAEWIALPEDRRRMLAYGVMLSRRGAFLARIGIVRASLTLLAAGSQHLPKLIARFASGRGSGTAERLVGEVRKLPESLWPSVISHWSTPKNFLAMAGHLETLPSAAATVAALDDPRAKPLTILSAATANAAQTAEWDRLAALGNPGEHIRAARSGHWIHLDEPELVIRAIGEMVLRYRS
jgi:pimeloyl-ACP methyl ester carboxylesterase